MTLLAILYIIKRENGKRREKTGYRLGLVWMV